MEVGFIELVGRIAPYYIIILLGFVAGRFLSVDRQSIANVLFYLIIPVIFFIFGMRLRMHADLFILPVMMFGISVLLNRTYLYLCQLVWGKDTRGNVIAYSAGTANAGYFGLPVALMIFDTETVAVYMLINIGMSFYDYTLGAFTIARSQFSPKQALNNVFKLPMLYAFFIGLLLNSQGVKIPPNFAGLAECFTGTYAILGLMIVGLGISQMKKFQIDWQFIGMLLSARFMVAPAIMIILVLLDQHYLHIFEREIHLAGLLSSLVPPAANTVVFAAIHRAHPEEAATAVLVGTLLALLYLPLMVAILF